MPADRPGGARRYCAPEVLRLVLAGVETVQRRSSSDLWSLGVVMYELYTGQRLFGESMSEEAVMALVCSVSAPAPSAPPALSSFAVRPSRAVLTLTSPEETVERSVVQTTTGSACALAHDPSRTPV